MLEWSHYSRRVEWGIGIDGSFTKWLMLIAFLWGIGLLFEVFLVPSAVTQCFDNWLECFLPPCLEIVVEWLSHGSHVLSSRHHILKI